MNIEGEERGKLDGVPETLSGERTEQTTESRTGPTSQSPPQSPAQPAATNFDLNHPTIISLLYLSSFVLGVTSIVGIVLAYVWKSEDHPDWQDSHFQYLINTFWIGLVGGFISFILMIVLIGFLMILAVAVLVIVRCVLSLINAQKQQPMPNPGTLLA